MKQIINSLYQRLGVSVLQICLIFKPLPYYTATAFVSQSWSLKKNLIFSICHPVILVLNFVFHIDATIQLFGGFLSGIAVWKADPRAGGWTADRGQPAGAMQAWLGDRQYEQHQVWALCSLSFLYFELPLEVVVFVSF